VISAGVGLARTHEGRSLILLKSDRQLGKYNKEPIRLSHHALEHSPLDVIWLEFLLWSQFDCQHTTQCIVFWPSESS